MLQAGLEPGTVVSRYRVEELHARGGMGLVYRATDVRLDRPVALKVLSPELSEDDRFRERFVRESRLAAAVDHPHVIPVYEADDWNGLLYLAMRFVRGVDLHTVLATRGALDPATATDLLIQGADALDAAHEAGLVHRDVKPGNFLLAGVARGLTNAEIGRELFIAEATVKTHLLRVFAKLGVDDRTRAVLVAVERGLLPGPGSAS